MTTENRNNIDKGVFSSLNLELLIISRNTSLSDIAVLCHYYKF